MRSREGWIFDLDGTLTVAAHDFDAIHRELELPAGMPILEAFERLPESEAAPKRRRLAEIEWEVARAAEPLPGAADLLATIAGRGSRLGILTRNNRRNAFETLRVCGLAERFDPADVFAREDADPKPSPAGIRRLLDRWGLEPSASVMVGDFRFDLEAGRAAGVLTVHVDVTGRFEYGELADVGVRSLAEIRRELHGGATPVRRPPAASA